MKIEDITEEGLLSLPNVQSVDFEHEWYFASDEINLVFMGAFQQLPTIPLPLQLKGAKGLRKTTLCLRYSDIKGHADSLSGLSDFNINIRTALNFNPKKK